MKTNYKVARLFVSGNLDRIRYTSITDVPYVVGKVYKDFGSGSFIITSCYEYRCA